MQLNLNSSIKKIFLLSFSCGLLLLTSCAPKLGGNDYEVSSVGEISTTLKGIITATKTVKLRPDNSSKPQMGAAAGAVSGAVLGSAVGGGHNMPLIAAVVGGLAGGAAGHAIENKLTEQDGTEYQIKLDTGKLISIAQGLEPRLTVGQKVLVIESNRGRSRVIADNVNN